MTRKHVFFTGMRMTPMERKAGRFMRAPDHPAADPAPAPAADPAPADPLSDDVFASAFDTHAADPVPDPAPAPAPADPAPAPAPDPAPAPAPADPAPAPAPDPAPAPAPAAPQLSAEEVLNRLASVINPQAPAAPAPAAPAADPAPVPVYTPEEQAVLDEYTKNWPDVARAEMLTRRGEYQDLMTYIFNNVAQYVAPLFENVKAVTNTLHTTELKGLVPDYTPDLETQVNEWIDTQPDYLQPAMKQVMQTGTSEQVANLFGRYKAETGAPAPAPVVAPAAPAPAPAAPAKPATELSNAAKQAAASLAPVSGARTHVAAADETSQDFETAFAKYAVEN